jgi:ATP-binding cassette subfamily B protein RaxB
MVGALHLGFRRRVPMLLQTEASECGLASLAMVARHHGFGIDLAHLRRKYRFSLKGATLKDLVAVAEAIGFAARPLRLDLDELPELRTPCVLHWDLNHFVVLVEVSRGVAVIHDPAVGVRRLPVSEVSRHFTGVALELTPTERFRTAKPAPRIGPFQALGRISGLGRSLGYLLALAIGIEFLLLLGPLLLGWVIDHAIVSADRDLLTTLALAFLLLLALQATFSAVRGWMLMGLNASLNLQSRANLFSHLVKLPLSFFETRHLGDVLSRFGSQEHILEAITAELVEAVLDGLMAGLTLFLMVIFAPKLAAIVAVGAMVYGLLRWVSFRPLRDASAEGIVWAARRDTHFLETVRGVGTIKLFNAQEERRAHWLNLLVETLNRQLTADKLRLLVRTANALVIGTVAILVIWIGARRVLDGGFSVGLLVAFVAYKDQFLHRVSALIDKVIDLAMLRLHAERLSDIALAEPEPVSERPRFGDGAEGPLGIDVRNLSFRYGEHDPWVLDGVTFFVRPGESVAIVGASGGGKTTLLKLLAGLLKPSNGEILVNGEPIERFGLAAYRSRIGVVMQDDHLFAGSLAENICFFAEHPDEARIRNAPNSPPCMTI